MIAGSMIEKRIYSFWTVQSLTDGCFRTLLCVQIVVEQSAMGNIIQMIACHCKITNGGID